MIPLFGKWTHPPLPEVDPPPLPEVDPPPLPQVKMIFFLEPKLENWDGMLVVNIIPMKILVTPSIGPPARLVSWGLCVDLEIF